jgi:hypothetical protein
MAIRQISLAAALLTSSIVLGAPGGALAAEDAPCSPRTLNGLYVFSASGDVVPASGPAQPKAIVEVIRFDGDGTLTVPAATRSVNGVVARSPPGGTGIYSVRISFRRMASARGTSRSPTARASICSFGPMARRYG